MNNNPLYIAFVWHMHQPYYKNLSTGEISLPWVRLHGTKDYLDMLEILSSFPRIHQTFNLVPSLIEQIDEYVRGGLDTKEVFLALSKKEVGALSSSEKQFMLQNFFMSNLDTMIKPYPRYRDLLEKRGEYIVSSKLPNIINRFNDQDYLDLQVLFNLAWVDPIFKQKDSFLKGLHEKGAYYTEDE